MTSKQMGEENGEFCALMAHLAVFILGCSLVPCRYFPSPGLKHKYFKKGDQDKERRGK